MGDENKSRPCTAGLGFKNTVAVDPCGGLNTKPQSCGASGNTARRNMYNPAGNIKSFTELLYRSGVSAAFFG
jgi:hypothetical protein